MRVDTWVEQGSEVPPYYDPMVAKIIVHDDDRAAARRRLSAALAKTSLHGIESNLAYLQQVLDDAVFRRRQSITRVTLTVSNIPAIDASMSCHRVHSQWCRIIPGRTGYWDIGVPPSGPMDHLSFRLANRIVG